MPRLNPDDLQAELMATFAVEARERVQALNRHLLALEAGAGEDGRERLIADLFREAHSLKGAARAVSLSEVEAVAHELEDLFTALREGGGERSANALERAYEMLDSIGLALPTGASSGGDAAEHDDTPSVKGDREPASHEPASEPAATSRREPEETVRITTDKLDALMAGVGELLVAKIGAERRAADIRSLEAALDDWDSSLATLRRQSQRPHAADGAPALLEDTGARLHATRADLAALRRLLEADARRSAQITTDLQDDVRRTRMLPVATVFESLPRMVRDLARDGDKEVTLAIAGGDTEVDRSVLERIKDPLIQLLRNAVDHGIETPDVRAAAGKPPATISLNASHRGDMLSIELADDGAGVDVARVRAGAVKKGLLTPAAAAELPDSQALALIFRSGLSTKPMVTDLSGRGIGLDVVREAVELLHGSVEVDSRPGVGTTFSLALPLAVSTMLCLVVEAGGQTFALPASAVERVMRVGAEEIGRAEGRETVQLDGRPVVLARLADVLGLDATADAREHQSKLPLIVLSGRARQAAFLVDRLLRTYELVIKNLPEPLLRVRHLAGATILASGQAAMLLSPADLIDSVERADGPARALLGAPDVPAATILVVEDSITTRTLEKNILEAAGYQVRLAADGGEGWSMLQADGCDLVVADVEMPVMDGFELTSRIRADQRHRDLPVVLVTSRDTPEDRELGIQAGADAYIVKGGFDQERLLDTIRRLI